MITESLVTTRQFHRVYDLIEARKIRSEKEPGSHQSQALQKLHKWYDSRPEEAGGILALPTGAGKTFTATRFLCSRPLSEGYKVLWLAHTHHLLDQASAAFKDNVAQIAEPKDKLATRVVSGTKGHFEVRQIHPADDVIVATLQTICHAWSENHQALKNWLASTKGKLFVVFDEAHHSPAPSYRILLQKLREEYPNMFLLGLTATPTYTQENKRGWLKRLFPQGILFSVNAAGLMAERILAKPICEDLRTNFTPRFDEREYQKWKSTYRDLPENIIAELAENRDRNRFIADTYVKNMERYGKTIIFADRWHQCEQISEFLKAQDVKVNTVYSHHDAEPSDVEARNKRTADDNARILDDFRNNKLDVLVNVRMLTEGTDVPTVKTVFVTRPTRSQILFTQMVGRALRGPKFGGTPEAYIVSFSDSWRQPIIWASYSQLGDGIADETLPEYGKRPPLDLISIELVQRLARQMDCGINMTSGPFLSLLPAGWYRVEYQTLVEGSEDINTVRELLIVQEDEVDAYQAFIHALLKGDLRDFECERVVLADVRRHLSEWISGYFPNAASHFGTDLEADVLAVARHVAQTGSAPAFFAFEERDKHNLDALAQEVLTRKLSRYAEDEMLRLEYNRADRLWTTIYPTYDLFKSQSDACINRLQHAERHGNSPSKPNPSFVTATANLGNEPTEAMKQQVRERDRVCKCCGEDKTRLLQVDHITSAYFGGGNVLENFQLLCKICNGTKGVKKLNFRDPQTDLTLPPSSLPVFDVPWAERVGDPSEWEKFLRRTINGFYQCGAVHAVWIGSRGPNFYHWRVELTTGNNPDWLGSQLRPLLDTIQTARRRERKQGPTSIMVDSPGYVSQYCADFPEFVLPSFVRANDEKAWKRCLRQAVDEYLSESAVKAVGVTTENECSEVWRIELKKGNEPVWLVHLLPKLMEGMRRVREQGGFLSPTAIVVAAPDKAELECKG